MVEIFQQYTEIIKRQETTYDINENPDEYRRTDVLFVHEIKS